MAPFERVEIGPDLFCRMGLRVWFQSTGSAPIAVGGATTQGAFAKVRRLPYLRL